jgi:hypothetical protein
MHSTTDDLNEGQDQTAPASPHAREPEGMIDAPRETEAPIEGPGESLQTRSDARRSADAEPPCWRPRPGEVLAGVIDRYTVSDTPQGPVRTVIVTEERTGEPISVQLASTSLLALFAEQQPHPGARIDVRYRGHTPDDGYQRWRLVIDCPAPLEWFPLGGETADEAPWHLKRRVVIAVAGLTSHPQAVV